MDEAGDPTTSGTSGSPLGARGARRAEPRASIAVAGAGCVLAVLGVLIVAGDTGTAGDDDLNRWPGVVLSAAVIVVGYLVVAKVRRGPLATGGAVAAALGVPPLLFFLTFDQADLPPYSSEAILVVSTVAWLGSYAVGPTRGRPFFLGAGLIALWATVLQVTEDVFDAPFAAFRPLMDVEPGVESFDQGFGGPVFDAPDPATLGGLSLLLGLGYLLAARALDRSGRHGTATPFAAAALPVLAVAPPLLADDLQEAGTGLLLVALGVALAMSGATSGRRATTWTGGGAVALGAGVFLSDMTDDPTVGGMLLLAAGAGLVFAGHLYATARREPDEMAVTGAPMAGTGANVTGVGANIAGTGATGAGASPWAPPDEPPPPPPPSPPTPPPPPF